jgi:hypothetical protein
LRVSDPAPLIAKSTGTLRTHSTRICFTRRSSRGFSSAPWELIIAGVSVRRVHGPFTVVTPAVVSGTAKRKVGGAVLKSQTGVTCFTHSSTMSMSFPQLATRARISGSFTTGKFVKSHAIGHPFASAYARITSSCACAVTSSPRFRITFATSLALSAVLSLASSAKRQVCVKVTRSSQNCGPKISTLCVRVAPLLLRIGRSAIP